MVQLRQLQQSQKLEAVGRLASGIAHEINTPMQYIGDNIQFVQDTWRSVTTTLPAGTDPEWDYALEEVPRAIAQSLEGVSRVTKIVRAMRDFSHPAGEDKTDTDINRAIETTLTVATTKWKQGSCRPWHSSCRSRVPGSKSVINLLISQECGTRIRFVRRRPYKRAYLVS